MNEIAGFIYKKAAPITALGVILVFYFLARQPEISQAESENLAKQFRFRQLALADENVPLDRNVRQVAPSLESIAAWVSSTGAAIALGDLDGDGLPNDSCKIDPRTDHVLIAPVPTTGERYAPFTLDGKSFDSQPTIAPMGCLIGDFNEDSLPDLLVFYWGRTPIAFLARRQNGQFPLNQQTYMAQEIIPGNERWFTGAATIADIDGDSHFDIVMGNYYQDGAEILDINSQTRQVMQHSMTRAANGGQSRILRWKSATAGENPAVNFEEIRDYVEATNETEKTELTHGWTLAIGACDLDGDLLPELYFANDFGPDRLLHNLSTPGKIRFAVLNGRKDFTTPNSKAVGRDGFKGMGVDFADINGDGVFDFFVSNIADEYALEESHFLFIGTGETDLMKKGIAPFVDRSEQFGVSRSSWSWDAKTGDFNNDGLDEIIQATGFIKGKIPSWATLHETAMGQDQLLDNPYNWHRFHPENDLSGDGHDAFFVRASDGRFYDLAEQVKFDRNQITRGIATADVNGDGKLDFAIANQWDTSFLYLNEAEQTGGFLGLHIRLPLQPDMQTIVKKGFSTLDVPSRAAIGAWVSVELPNGKKLISFVDGGNGHSGKRSSDVHFGLGNLPPGVRLPVEIRWRDAEGQIRSAKLEIEQGWNTIILGENPEG